MVKQTQKQIKYSEEQNSYQWTAIICLILIVFAFCYSNILSHNEMRTQLSHKADRICENCNDLLFNSNLCNLNKGDTYECSIDFEEHGFNYVNDTDKLWDCIVWRKPAKYTK